MQVAEIRVGILCNNNVSCNGLTLKVQQLLFGGVPPLASSATFLWCIGFDKPIKQSVMLLGLGVLFP